MTVKELKEFLSGMPEDAIVMYRHNKFGRIDVDKMDYKEETLLSGETVKCLTFEASFEED